MVCYIYKTYLFGPILSVRENQVETNTVQDISVCACVEHEYHDL